MLQNYKEKDAGKVVVYTTTMGIVRETYHTCQKVKQILRTLLVKYEERDVFMSSEYQAEIRDRMRCDQILVPQVFVDGQHVGVSTAGARSIALEPKIRPPCDTTGRLALSELLGLRSPDISSSKMIGAIYWRGERNRKEK